MPISRSDIIEAATRINGRVRRTPIIDVTVPTPVGPVSVVLKLESLQLTGSFKARGAMNSLMLSDATSVVACSGGNHGLAVAWAAEQLGKRALIVVPVTAATTKVEAMRRTGAEVIQTGEIPADAFTFAAGIVTERGWPMIHPYNQEPTIAGQGTLGLELIEQAPQVTHWLTAVGGGGLASGLALALEGQAKVVAVEPFGCPSLFEAQRANGPVVTKAEGIARTSLGAPSLGDLPWVIIKERVGQGHLVSDESIAAAQLWLWRELRVVAEPGGATALAALLDGTWRLPPDSRAGVIICGGNADSLPVY